MRAINENKKTYKHSPEAINNKDNNNENLTDLIMSYVSKTKMPNSIKGNIKEELTIVNNKDENKDNVASKQVKKKKKKKNRMDY